MELRGQLGGVDFLFPPAHDLGIKLWSSGPLPMEPSLGPKTSHFHLLSKAILGGTGLFPTSGNLVTSCVNKCLCLDWC